MCTVTWLRADDGYELFCNRDERHERGEAWPPAVHEEDGVHFAAPTDPDGGGTWIVVNSHGLALCLLNGYAQADDLLPAASFTSRGLLVRELATARSPDDVALRLGTRSLAGFRSFRLLVLAAGRPACAAVWDRATSRLTRESPELPLISCPVRTDEVRAARRDTLLRLVAEHGALDGTVLAAFHRSRHPAGWIWSVSMQHDVARTRSHSHVKVTAERVEFVYTPGRPCSTRPLPVVAFARAAAGNTSET